MQLKIKICGLKTPELVDVAVDAGADMIGFVHFGKSPRHIEQDQIGALINHLGNRAQSVVLLVNPDNETLLAIDALRPHFIQLHGGESEERVKEIKELVNAKLIKALPVGTIDDLAPVSSFAPLADLILLDAKPPQNSDIPGGNGEVFDWSLLNALDPSLKFMLSGGLDVDNVADAVKQIRPFAIDVSSGVERARGEKDAEKIRRFISRATIASV